MSRIGISGSSGLIGRRLSTRLRDAGHTVIPLVRRDSQAGTSILWDPAGERFDTAACEDLDAIVHLAGENVAKGRWTTRFRSVLRASRIDGTRLLVEGLLARPRLPRVLVCASASGFYGDRGEQVCDETASCGTGFLAELTRDWEVAGSGFDARGRRVVLRIGMVLARDGGALPRIALPFRFGLGGRLGSGRQWMSWIALDDLCGVIERALDDDSMRGTYNAVSPGPVRNAEFTRTLAGVLHRPAILPAPAFALRLALGAMADELLLTSQRLAPARLLAAGFRFAHEELEAALRDALRR